MPSNAPSFSSVVDVDGPLWEGGLNKGFIVYKYSFGSAMRGWEVVFSGGPGGGGGTLGISGGGCAAGAPKPLTYTRPSSAEFCYPILE